MARPRRGFDPLAPPHESFRTRGEAGCSCARERGADQGRRPMLQPAPPGCPCASGSVRVPAAASTACKRRLQPAVSRHIGRSLGGSPDSPRARAGRAYARPHLDDEGFDVDAVHTSELALERAGHPRVELILLDLMLPGIGEFTVCRRLRKADELPITTVTAIGLRRHRHRSGGRGRGLREQFPGRRRTGSADPSPCYFVVVPPSRRLVLGDVELRAPTRGSPCPRRSSLAGLPAAARDEDALARRKRRLHVHSAAGVCDLRGTTPVSQDRAMASYHEPGLLVPGSCVASVNAVYAEHHTPRTTADGSYDVHVWLLR